MRIAILADIHGNLPALEAALAQVEKLGVDRCVVAGDVVVGSPDSLACWQRVKGLGCPVVRGNHERYVCDFGTERARPEWSTPRFSPVQFAAAQLGDAVREELARLPMTAKLPEAPELLFTHGSPRSDIDQIFPYTAEQAIAEMLAGVGERWVMRGHNHYAGTRLVGERWIVTVGSVGLPLDGTPSAQFTILERRKDNGWKVEHHSVPYDVAATVRRFHETGYLETAGPMARLFLQEVVTASFRILPFLRFMGALEQRGERLPIDLVFEKYLQAGGVGA
jgi:predicted phosphodiesterase